MLDIMKDGNYTRSARLQSIPDMQAHHSPQDRDSECGAGTPPAGMTDTPSHHGAQTGTERLEL